jgi:hypothetical protein
VIVEAVPKVVLLGKHAMPAGPLRFRRSIPGWVGRSHLVAAHESGVGIQSDALGCLTLGPTNLLQSLRLL